MNEQRIEMVNKMSDEGQEFRICSVEHGYSIETREDGEWIIMNAGMTWDEANMELDMMTGEDIDFEEYEKTMSEF